MGSALGWILNSVEEKAWNAAKDGDISTLQDLCMSSIAAMEWREAERGRTAFIMACSKGHVDCARWLVENGVDVYGRDYRGNTPLHYACLYGQPRVVELLLAQPQFSPFTLNAKGLSPLDAAREAYSDAADDRAVSTMADIAACIELLEERLVVHQDVIFTRTDNAVSRVVGIASLRSWTCSHAMVFRTSSSLFLELALYATASPEVPLRCGPVPSSSYFVLIDPVNRPTTFVKQQQTPSSSMSSWLMASKAHAFSLLAAPKTAASSVPTLDWVDFAALDAAGLDAWAAFFVEIAVTKLSDPTLSHDHQFNTQTLGRCHTYQNYVAPPTPVPAPPPPEEDIDIEDANGVVIAQLLSLAPRKPPPANSKPDASITAVDCVVCFDAPQSAVCVPCGHIVLCMQCATRITSTSSRCPLCRQHVREVIQVYRS